MTVSPGQPIQTAGQQAECTQHANDRPHNPDVAGQSRQPQQTGQTPQPDGVRRIGRGQSAREQTDEQTERNRRNEIDQEMPAEPEHPLRHEPQLREELAEKEDTRAGVDDVEPENRLRRQVENRLGRHQADDKDQQQYDLLAGGDETAAENPRTLDLNSFRMTNPRGFGLIQRDRDFEHYQDLETRMETRPSVWIAPKGDWGSGDVELVQIPTQADIHDNIVAYWVPAEPADPAKPLDYSYRMTWYSDDATRPPAGRAIATRRDRGTFEDGYRFVIDFESRQLETLPADTVLQGVVTVSGASLREQQVVKNPVNGQWRLTFQVSPNGGSPVEMRAFLKKGEEALTETWSYVLEP